MIFEGKSIHIITDDEIDKLVNDHIAERQHLEFKITINRKEDSEKSELLHDIVSFANGGGGYLIVGIRDDGKGRAQKYEPELVGNTESIKRAIMSLCHDHISERIEGLEVVARIVRKNPLVIVRIPASARVPHMVTYQNRTDFYSRYHDGKREMTIGEIKEAFRKDIVERKLSTIEASLHRIIANEIREEEYNNILKKIESNEVPQFLSIEEGSVLSDITFKLFKKEIDKAPYFRMAITPMDPRRNLINVDSNSVRQLIKVPPGSRLNGWNMESSYSPIERFAEGVQRGKKDHEYLTLFENGHMDFWTPLDEHFCWGQSPEEFRNRPRLYPYPVVEYPATFLRLYRALIDVSKLKDDFLINLCYRNLKGYILIPYAPRSSGFEFPLSEVKPFNNEHLIVRNARVSNDFKPDKTTYGLIKIVYASFGLGVETIPFFSREKEKFIFSSS